MSIVSEKNLVWIGTPLFTTSIASTDVAPGREDCEMTGLNPYLPPSDLPAGETFLPDRILEVSLYPSAILPVLRLVEENR